MSSAKHIVKKIAYKLPFIKDRIGLIKMIFKGESGVVSERNELLNELAVYKDRTRDQMEKMALDRPFDIALETYSRCNSLCVFCAYRKVRRKKELMPMEMFEKICNEYVEMGGGSLGFAPLLADPLLDPFLLDRMRLARKWHPRIRMYFFTNAIQFSRFSDEDILYILDSIEGMNISLSVLSREDYRKMFQVDKYDAVMNNIERISRLIREVEFPPYIGLHVRTSQREATLGSETLKRLAGLGYGCEDVADTFSDWGGIIEKEDLPEGTNLFSRDNSNVTAACLIPMISLTITASGDALACGCFDAKMEHVVGNVGLETLEEIWYGDKLTSFRESFEKKRLPDICTSCAQYVTYQAYFHQSNFIGFNPEIHSFWSSLHCQRPYSHAIVYKKDFRYFFCMRIRLFNMTLRW